MSRRDYLPDINSGDKKLLKLFKAESKKLEEQFYKLLEVQRREEAQATLKKIRGITAIMQKYYDDRAEVKIPEEYLKWLYFIDNAINGENKLALLKDNKASTLLGYAGPIHKEAVDGLLNTSRNYVKASLDGVNNNASNILTKIEYNKVKEKLAVWIITGKSVKDELIESFKKNGVVSFKDRSGRNWNINRYVDMLTRTESKIANTQGTINRAVQLGIYKFKIYEQASCCEHCSIYNGKIVDIKNNTVDLPPFHPNCRGYINPVIWEEEFKAQNGKDVTLKEVKEKAKKEKEIKTDVNKADDTQNIKAVTPEQKIEKALDIIEQGTQFLEYEQGAYIDKDGNIVRSVAGHTGYVNANMLGLNGDGYTFTHNHPNSSVFSDADLAVYMRQQKLVEIRASSKIGTYSIKWGTLKERERFYRACKWSIYKRYIQRETDKNILTYWLKAWSLSGTKNDFIKYKDGSIIYRADDPLEFDRKADQYIRSVYRRAMEIVANNIGLDFKFTESAAVKYKEASDKYLSMVKELKKNIKTKWQAEKDEIEINNFI